MKAISHPDPRFMGKTLPNWVDPKGNKVIQNIRETALQQGSGFTRYWWVRLTGEKPLEKLAYVRLFPQWHWIVGTGVYIDDIAAAMQDKLKEVISDPRNGRRS
jgi:signal transduction histidine kinase